MKLYQLLKNIKNFPKHLNGLLASNPNKNGEYKFLEDKMPKLTNASIVFDVGANIGDYAAKMHSYNNTLQIYCFEPVPDTYLKLKERVSINKNIILNNTAMSDNVGSVKMFEYKKYGGINSIENHGELMSSATKVINVELNTIDNYCDQHGIDKINFLKIDVEGHELNVIRGAEEMIRNKSINILQFEYNYLWRNTNNTLEGVMKILSVNYDIYRLTFWGKILIDSFDTSLENYPHASNYVAILKT
jgi:FkbM family methyltransferase